MTEREAYYNFGVSAATAALRLAASAIPPSHALSGESLLSLAATIDGLKIGDPKLNEVITRQG